MPQTTATVTALLVQTVHAARTGDYGTAASQLNRAIPTMQKELASGIASPDILAQATRFLDELFNAQKRGDWVAFADVLEFGFIEFWQNHFSPPC